MDDYINVKQAATRLGVTKQRVLYLIGHGRLAAEQVSPKCWMVQIASVEARLADPPASGWRGQVRNQVKGATDGES